jgi:ATP-dependent exoDNAse (exonuclease V) beta subunit
VIVDEDRVTVLDYKTGGEELEEEYRVQVAAYMQLARDVYPGRAVEGMIIYVDKKKAVRVV